MHRLEEEGSVAIVLVGEVTQSAEQGLLVLVIVERDEGRKRGSLLWIWGHLHG